MRTWDGSCGNVIAQLIFEKRERRSSAWNREQCEAKARETKIERTASADTGPARHNMSASPHAESLASPQPRPGGRSGLAGKKTGRGSALSPAALPLPPGPTRQSAGGLRPNLGGTERGTARGPGPALPRRDSTLPGQGRREGTARAPCGHASGREREERPTPLPQPRLRLLGACMTQRDREPEPGPPHALNRPARLGPAAPRGAEVRDGEKGHAGPNASAAGLGRGLPAGAHTYSDPEAMALRGKGRGEARDGGSSEWAAAADAGLGAGSRWTRVGALRAD